MSILEKPQRGAFSFCLIAVGQNVESWFNIDINRNSLFYFDYIAERFVYFHNSVGTNIRADYESYMIAGHCSEFY